MRPLVLAPFVFACTQTDPVDAVGLVRLTPAQWESSAAHVVASSEPPGLSDHFVSDPVAGKFDNNAAQLQVTPVLQQQLQDAAIALAARTTTTEALLDALLGAEGSRRSSAERDAWLREVGRRAFRRDLTPDEVATYRDLFEEGQDAFPEQSRWAAGARMVLVGLLQSPHFLYRVEQFDPQTRQLRPLSFATRLAYALWQAPPDEALLAAGEAAPTARVLLDEVPRLLADDRSRHMVADFHWQLLHVEAFENIPREFVSYEDYGSTLNAALQAEVLAFVDEIVFSGGTVRDLLTSRLTFVDEQVAEIYGLDGVVGVGDEVLEPVSLPADQRAGLLTLAGFLAVHSSDQSENLIRRSAFVHESLLCTSLPPPPDNATALPPVVGAQQSQRERIEDHTAECGGACHSQLINPIAFAFGQYDALGVYRDSPRIDASAVFGFTFGETAFDGAVELAELLSIEPIVHDCYATNLLGYLEGRVVDEADAARVAALSAASQQGAPILDLIESVVEHPDFQRAR